MVSNTFIKLFNNLIASNKDNFSSRSFIKDFLILISNPPTLGSRDNSYYSPILSSGTFLSNRSSTSQKYDLSEPHFADELSAITQIGLFS